MSTISGALNTHLELHTDRFKGTRSNLPLFPQNVKQ
jgi:hypothetical protein